MRKFISLMMVLFTATSVTFALEGGKITPSKASFGPTETVTLTYDGTGTNFANWQPLCFVHAWLVAAEGQTFSKSYGTDWASCNGDADYAALDAKLKMTFVSKGVYTIDMNIKDFFDVAEADLAKIGKLGIIVRAQYEGDKNQTEDMFLNVGSEQEVTLYFVKPDDWNGVMAYVYDKGGYYKDYPGEEMVKTDKKLKGKDVYSYTFPEKYNMIGFVSKDGERNTGNYAWNTTIPYYYDDGDGYAGNNWWAEDDLVDQMTVYFFNSLDWAKVNTFVWPESGNAYKTWPGQAAKKETEQIHGKDVYAYSFPVTYVNVIFNNGDKQTVDLKWDADKPYFVPGETDSEGKYKGTWYAKADIPAPEVPAKYYVTGDTALVIAAGVDKMKAWQPNAIKSEADTLELNLAAGDYVLKLTLDGTWAEGKARGYSNLTAPAAEGLSADKDDNICFKLTEAGIVKVIYFVAEEKETFKLEGKFYVKPVVKKELNLVPGVWANDKAQIAAWIWGAELDGQWTAFFAGKDTLKAEINAAADSIVFVRFNDQVAAPTWDNEATNVWNKMAGDTIDYAGLTYTITDWAKGQWTVYVPEVPAKYYVTGDTALVVAAGVDKMKAWQPNAIKSEADTLELNLAAGDYVLKLTLDGTWAEGKARGYSNLTVPAAEGLSADKDDNICFKLTEAGIVKVIYFVAEEKETFKLEGKFYVAPVEKKYYAKNNWGAGSEWTWKEMTKDDEDSYYLQAVFGGTGVNINTAESEEGQLWFAAKDIDAFLNVEGLPATTLEAKDTVIFYYTPSEEMLAALVIGKYVPTLADGFYLVGTFNGVDAWNLSDLSAEKLFKATDVEGQYSIDVTLMDGDHFKAIKVEKDAIIQWYPDGTDNDYVVDASHAGQKTIYFRPSFWQDWNGHFYVAPNGGDAINNINATKAVKVLRDGQIMIIKGNKTFNVLGAEIR